MEDYLNLKDVIDIIDNNNTRVLVTQSSLGTNKMNILTMLPDGSTQETEFLLLNQKVTPYNKLFPVIKEMVDKYLQKEEEPISPNKQALIQGLHAWETLNK